MSDFNAMTQGIKVVDSSIFQFFREEVFILTQQSVLAKAGVKKGFPHYSQKWLE